jgi:hypothetical protein
MSVLKKYVENLEENGVSEAEAKTLEKKALDNFEMAWYKIPKSQVMIYRQLADYSSIFSLMGSNRLIFLLYQPLVGQMGHWVLLWKEGNRFQYFCPYGLPIDAPITDWYNDGQPEYLGDLLRKEKRLDITYNAFDFQLKNHDVSTCGRWCILRAQSIVFNHLSLEQFIELMTEMKRITGREFDNLVSDLVNVKSV